MSYYGVGNLVFIRSKIDKIYYLKILNQNLKLSASKMGINDRFAFYQENDPKNTIHVVKGWLRYNYWKVIKTPPQSPDANPIENFWNQIVKNKFSENDIKQALFREWLNVSLEY